MLVAPGPTILPELYGTASEEGRGRNYRKLVEYATRHARGLGVELVTNTRVASATPLEVLLSNGERVPTRTIISAVGTRPTPVLAALDLPRDERGRVGVDRTLRVEGHEHVWAGGDCAAVPHPSGGTCPSVGIYALKHGEQIAANLRQHALGPRGAAVPLPRSRAGRLDRRAHGRRRGEGDPDPRPARVDRLALRCSSTTSRPGTGGCGCSPTGRSGRSSAVTSSRWAAGRRSATTTSATTSTSPAR